MPFGNIQGSIGEVSTFAILFGAAVLLWTRIASWRIMSGCVIGLIATSLIFNMIGSEDNLMMNLPFYWHLVIGGFAFGAVFMATDPVSAAHTNKGRWAYGILIGFMTVLIRVVNPAFPEGIMLAILLPTYLPHCLTILSPKQISNAKQHGGSAMSKPKSNNMKPSGWH